MELQKIDLKKMYVAFERFKAKSLTTQKIKLVQIINAYFLRNTSYRSGFLCNSPVVLNFVREKFAGAALFVLYGLRYSYAFDGMYNIEINYIFYAQKTYILAWRTF